jgi:hypothetical protein
LRQFSRAFILDDGKERLVFVSVDSAMIGHGLRREVSTLRWAGNVECEHCNSCGYHQYKYSMVSVHERPCSRTIRLTSKFSEQKTSRMTNGFSDYEHASWQQR